MQLPVPGFSIPKWIYFRGCRDSKLWGCCSEVENVKGYLKHDFVSNTAFWQWDSEEWVPPRAHPCDLLDLDVNMVVNFPSGFLRVGVGLTRSCCCEQTSGPEVAPGRRDLFGLLLPERWSIMAESCGSKRLEQRSSTTHKKQRERMIRSGVRLRILKAHPQWWTLSNS